MTLDFPDKAKALERVAALKAQIIGGQLKVPSNLAELEKFTAPAN